MRRLLTIGVGVLALAACQKKPGEAARTAGEAAKPAVASGPMAPPARKPGLWTQTMTTAGMHQTMKMCLDAATEKSMQITGQQAGKDLCSKSSITPAAGGWRIESVCDTGQGGTITTTGTATGDLTDHYTMQMTSVTTGASMPQANGTHEMTLEAKWEGPCPAGMRPGDMQMAGMTINMNDMQARAAAMGKRK